MSSVSILLPAVLYVLAAVQPYVGAVELNKKNKVDKLTAKQVLMIVGWPFYSLRFLIEELLGDKKSG